MCDRMRFGTGRIRCLGVELGGIDNGRERLRLRPRSRRFTSVSPPCYKRLREEWEWNLSQRRRMATLITLGGWVRVAIALLLARLVLNRYTRTEAPTPRSQSPAAGSALPLPTRIQRCWRSTQPTTWSEIPRENRRSRCAFHKTNGARNRTRSGRIPPQARGSTPG
jgi:hypothetical protein